MRIGVHQFCLLCVLVLLIPACRISDDEANDALPTPDHEGVLHNLTETSAELILGFKPVRPNALPDDYAVHELSGQASLLSGTATDGLPRWGAPYVAVYTLWPTRETRMPGGMQLHQTTVDQRSTYPFETTPEQIAMIGTKQVEKAVHPTGSPGIANISYRWTGAATNLHLLVLATTGGELAEADVEAMIAALPD